MVTAAHQLLSALGIEPDHSDDGASFRTQLEIVGAHLARAGAGDRQRIEVLTEENGRLRTEVDSWFIAAGPLLAGSNLETRQNVAEACGEHPRLRRLEAAVLEYEEAADETGPTKHNPWLCDIPRRDCAACSRYDAGCTAKDLAISEARPGRAKDGEDARSVLRNPQRPSCVPVLMTEIRRLHGEVIRTRIGERVAQAAGLERLSPFLRHTDRCLVEEVRRAWARRSSATDARPHMDEPCTCGLNDALRCATPDDGEG